jgi:hypothetical protein
MRSQLPRILLLALWFACAQVASAASVNYTGVLTEGGASTLTDDWVIAGTFAPGFDVINQYWWTFGDNAANWLPTHYANAVATGTFRPIGSGTFPNVQGAFSGMGSTTGIDNQPIWIFMFQNAQPETSPFMALISSTDPSWRVQNDGVANINTSTANIFVVGHRTTSGAIQLDGAPVPEPATCVWLGACVVASVLRVRRCRKTLQLDGSNRVVRSFARSAQRHLPSSA